MNAKQWVKSWKAASIALEEIRLKELRAFDLKTNWQQVDSLLEAGCVTASLRPSSGLVDQQKIFLRKRSL